MPLGGDALCLLEVMRCADALCLLEVVRCAHAAAHETSPQHVASRDTKMCTVLLQVSSCQQAGDTAAQGGGEEVEEQTSRTGEATEQVVVLCALFSHG